jgi:cytochrome b subunit of formate dehydrogenase
VTDLGLVTAATCSDCHTPHRNLPAQDAASSVHASNLPATCGACHGEVSAAFASYDPHADPRSPTRHPWVHRTWLFMTGLLLVVFGFFAVHDLLWLQRSLVGVLRGEFAAVRSHSGPYVKRFSPEHVWLHAIVVVSFLVLAATGLPLKFHLTGWAKQLVTIVGGVNTAGVLHRLAALATLGYAFFHLWDLFRRIFLRGERDLLWGWRSLVPQPGDLVDLWRHVRYFLYLGARPAFDRWTYWEKFDYFAVFWGVIIIGTSGLMLWLPRLFTTFLPGWALNAAFVVHSDEALLAVGFIFLFHFFHTHLRPESFPLDPVIFVGRMPLERFKAERPLEYERLLSRNELEGRLVDPPTRVQVRAARAFGFGALFVGLALVVALLWSVLESGLPT